MMQRRMSQENPIRASETEFVQRLQRLVVLAVNRLIYYGKQCPPLRVISSDRSCLSPDPGSRLYVSLISDVSEDLFDLLNIPDSPDHHTFTPDPSDQPHDESGSCSVPHSPTPFILPHASKKSFQKDVLKLMMDGIKISLVLAFFSLFLSSCCLLYFASTDKAFMSHGHRAAQVVAEPQIISGGGSSGPAGTLSGCR